MNQITYRRRRRHFKYCLEAAKIFRLPFEGPLLFGGGGFLRIGGGVLRIGEGYSWDGASGPTIDSPSSMRASLVHDALYQLIREGLLPMERRIDADKLFREMCLENGMDRVRAAIWYRSLRWFGGAAARPRREDEVLTAP